MKPGPYLIWGLLGAAAIVVLAVFLAQSKSARTEAAIDGDVFRSSAILGGRNHRNVIDPFVGGEVSAFMGGMKLDLTESAMGGNTAEMDVFVMMGGIDLRIPRDWVVVNDLDLLLGGIDDRSQTPAGVTAKRLVLRGTVLMGGVSVKN